MKKRTFFYSIRFRLIIVLILTLTVPLIIFSAINIYTEKKNYLDRVEQNIEEEINTLDKIIISYIENIEDDINYLVEEIMQTENLDDINKINAKYIKDKIKILAKNNGDIEHIYLALENGEIYIDDESRIPQGYNPVERPFYKDTIKSKEDVTLSSIYKWEGENLLTLSKVVKNKNNIVGVLGIDININKIHKLVNDVKSNNENHETIILDDENNIVCNTMNSNLNIFNDTNNTIKNEFGLYELEVGKTKYVFNYKDSELENWKITKLINYKDINIELKRIKLSRNILLISVLVIVLCIILLVSKDIYKPMQYIMNIIESIRFGNYDVEKLYNKANEFGTIEDSLYSMGKEIKESREILEKLAYKDLNLGINNKNKLFDQINTSFVNKNKPLSIILIDIKNLKLFNERFGYGKGDEFLMKISQFLLTIIPENNVFRYDSDEFAIMIYGNNKKELDEIVNKIHDRFNQSWLIRDINYSTTVTIVIMDNQSNVDYNLDIILNNFEYTMKEAKAKNLKTGIVIPNNILLKRKNKIKEILETCIENNKLAIYYQPIRNIEVNKYKKMEALIRLKDENMGIISPFEFIEIAEETGQIYDIGLYILESACKKIIELDNENIEIEAISINISVVQFINENFTNDVVDIINKYNIDSTRLIFEITENIFIGSYSKILSIMNELSKKGIKFALDDFGTGYSSLSYFLNLPIDIIKIDKSFITSMDDDKSKDIISLIVSMCQKLKLEVIVEGIETNEQLDILKKIGCTNIQGYYFSRPIPDNEVNKLL